MKRAFGLDSSVHDISFDPLEADIAVDFVFLRTGYALMKDKIFLDSAIKCDDAGLPWMAYHYLSTAVPWNDQVDFMVEMTSKAPGLPAAYWIDFELAYNEMTLNFASECAQAIQLLTISVSQKVGLYTNNYLYNAYIAKSDSWHLGCPRG